MSMIRTVAMKKFHPPSFLPLTPLDFSLKLCRQYDAVSWLGVLQWKTEFLNTDLGFVLYIYNFLMLKNSIKNDLTSFSVQCFEILNCHGWIDRLELNFWNHPIPRFKIFQLVLFFENITVRNLFNVKTFTLQSMK